MKRVTLVLLLAIVAFFAVMIARGRSGHETVAAQPARPEALIVPVAGVARSALIDSWHDARDGGARAHQALDIAAPRGTPVIAAMTGTVEKLFQSNAGGTTAYIRSDDGKWIAYYAHLQRYAAGLAEGHRIVQGDAVGFVGDTGNAGTGNDHLHFALQRVAPDEKWYQGTAVNPYPLLARVPPAR